MKGLFDGWTIGRRITAGFLAMGGIALVLFFTFQTGISTLVSQHREAASRADEALRIGDAAGSGARLYQVVADAEINMDLETTDRQWADVRKNVDAQLAEVAALVDTDEERVQIASARTHAKEIARLIDEEMLPTLKQDRKVSEAARMVDTVIYYECEQMTNDLQAISAAMRKESADTSADFERVRTRTEWLAMIAGLVGFVVAIVLVYFVVTSVTKRLSAAAASLDAGAQQVMATAEQVSGTAQSLSRGSTEQAASLEETSASMEEMASMTRRNADNTQQAVGLVADVHTRVHESESALRDMVQSMSAIQESSRKVSRIIRTIDEIAFQTNLLALNAAVEAARAGDAGMGFAVVADEVRNLAQRSARAARDTATLIEESIERAKGGTAAVDLVAQAVTAIADSVTHVKGLVDEVSEASRQQTAGIDQVAQALSQMDKVTQGVAATAEESAATSEELQARAAATLATLEELNALVGRSLRASEPVPAARTLPAAGTVVPLPARPRMPAPPRAEDILPLENTGTFGSF